jgi:hypothetical protein
MSFEEIVRTCFPGSMPEKTFVRRCALTLIREHGFTPQNTLACVGICRDQACRPLSDRIRETWGELFDLSALAGAPTLGRSGLAAARANAPIVQSRSRLAFFVLAHIGIGPGGELGVVERRGRSEPSAACGALQALLAETREGRRQTVLDDWGDPEQSLLRRRLTEVGALATSPDLIELTKAAHRVGLAALETLIDEVLKHDRDDYSVVAGVQIHGPAGARLVWPGASYVVLQGRRSEIWF